MTNIFIVSHVDDAELSCGGTIQKLIAKGDHVKVYSLSHVYNGKDLSSEFIMSMQTLKVESFQYFNAETRRFNAHENRIADIIYEKIKGYDNVYTHSTVDRHPDHKIVAEQVKRIHNGNLFTFICPWNGQHKENYFVEILPGELSIKKDALRCYESQRMRDYMSDEFTEAEARYNGIKCGKLYAEAFKVERLVF